MTKEELFFKENYPEYVTEKGECLSPYWDLFNAGVICATFELNNKIAELKDKLNNLASVAEVRLANWQKCAKDINVLTKDKDYFSDALDKQIEATYKLFEENKELKEKLKPENCLKLLAKEGYIKFSSDQLTYAKTIIQDLLDNTDEYARQRAEDFLKENK